jgi:hypothetical protein
LEKRLAQAEDKLNRKSAAPRANVTPLSELYHELGLWGIKPYGFGYG